MLFSESLSVAEQNEFYENARKEYSPSGNWSSCSTKGEKKKKKEAEEKTLSKHCSKIILNSVTLKLTQLVKIPHVYINTLHTLD